ncbi:hypothetical protein ACFLYB_04755 [Chloroflexota bacterium]
MKATADSISAEFETLHGRYLKANERMALLQATAAEGMRKIGVGCITQESRVEFVTLQKEIELVLAKMKEICDTLHEIDPKPD